MSRGRRARRGAWPPRAAVAALLAAIISAPAAASPGSAPVVVGPADKMRDLGRHIDVLPDPAGALTFARVSAPAFAARFAPADGKVAYGDSSRVMWVRARIRNGASSSARYFLIVEWRNLHRITAFIPHGGRTIEKQTGWLVPFSQRDVPAPFLAFALDHGPEEEKTIYLKVESSGEIFLPVNIWPQKGLYLRVLLESLTMGAYFGFLLALGIYTLVLFFRLRLGYLLIYVAYLSVEIMWWFIYAGYYGMLPGLLPLGEHLPTALDALYVFMRLWFARSFLNIRVVAPRVDLALKITQVGVVPVAWLVSVLWMPILDAVVPILVNLALFAVAVLCVRRGVRQARLYAVAAGMIAFGFAISGVAFTGLVDVPLSLMGFPLMLASMVELILLSLALASHVRSAEAARQQALSDVQTERIKMMRSLVAGVVHELNTPVGSLRSGLDALDTAADALEEVTDAPRRGKLARLKKALPSLTRTTRQAMERIGVVLGSLKTYSRLDEAEEKAVDLHQGLDSALVLLGRELQGRITVERRYGEIPLVVCRPAEINQVLMAVLKNGIEAIAGQGTITISTTLADDRVRVAIADDGGGIPPGELAKIFNPSFSSKGERVRLGLGLPTSQSIVDAHGGRLTIESEHGAGTTVLIELRVHARG